MSSSQAFVERDPERRYLLGAIQLEGTNQRLRRDVERLLNMHAHLRLTGWSDEEVSDLARARGQLLAAVATLERQVTDFRAGAVARCRYCRARLDGQHHHLDETRCVFAPAPTFGGRLSSRLRSWQLTYDPETAHVL